MDRLFGDVRSVMQCKPSTSGWVSLIALLESCEPTTRTTRVLPYVETHMGRWPDELRTVPVHWLDAIARGLPIPTGLSTLPRALTWTHARQQDQLHLVLRQLPRHRWLGQLTQIDLSYNFLKAWPVLTLLRSPSLTGLRRLNLSFNSLGGLSVVAAMRLEHLQTMVEVSLDGLGIEDRHVMGLTRTMRISALERLSLANNRLTDASMQELMFCDVLDALTHLTLSSNALTSHGLHAMSVGRAMPGLTSLNLSRNLLRDQLHYLSDGFGQRLEHLNLSDNPLGDDGVHSLCRGEWSALRALHLRGVKLSHAGTLALGSQSWTVNLDTLDLAYNPIFGDTSQTVAPHHQYRAQTLDLTQTQLTPDALERFVVREAWPALRTLNLSFNELGDDGVMRLIRSGVLSNVHHLKLDRCGVELRAVQWPDDGELRTLDLSGNTLDAKGLMSLLHSGVLQNLEALILKHCAITDELLAQILRSPVCASLVRLDLSENYITDTGVRAFARDTFTRLRWLDLSKNELSPQGVEILAEQPYIQSLAHLSLLWNRGEHFFRS